jgi:hypothetical protein
MKPHFSGMEVEEEFEMRQSQMEGRRPSKVRAIGPKPGIYLRIHCQYL